MARSGSPSAPHNVEIRVAVQDNASSLTIGASTNAVVFNAQQQRLGQLPSMQATIAQVDGQAVRVGGFEASGGVWIVPDKGGGVFVGDHWYRGRLLLVAQGSGLLAINYVNLETYLYSVVGSEVSPSWPFEALKAQAVAARSYALAHRYRPASRWYDLGRTERWQVYRGLKSEWNTTQAAVNATHGQVITYGNGLVETLYAASQDIVNDVFGGFGMSQKGAYEMARRGYNYRQILGHFYPGTALAQIRAR